jgi:Ca-activated chloride channel family protein
VAIVITDGEDFGYNNSSLKNQLNQYPSNIFYLGVGTETGGLLTRNGEIITNEDGVQALSKLNKAYLQELAGSVSQVFFLDNERKPFPEISERISNMGQQVIDARKILVLNNKYSNFLLIALILAALDALIKIKQFKI